MKHIPALDGLRGVAILLVMLHHQTLLPGSGVWTTVADLGWAGVDLFFVLSGFLITGILFDARGAPNCLRNFYVRRVLRIFPVYYALLLFAFVVLPRLPLSDAHAAKVAALDGTEWWYWLYLQNVAMVRAGGFPHAVLGVTWSLAIEEQFYLLWPFLVLGLPRRALMKVCLALVVAAPVVRCALAFGGAGWLPAYVLTPCRIDALAFGAWIALAARGRSGLDPLKPWAWLWIGVGVTGTVAVSAASGGTSFKRFGLFTFGFTFLALAFGGWLLLAATTARPRALAGRVLKTFGKYSYALYLFHMPCRVVVKEHLFRPIGPLTQIAFYAAATALPLAIAWVSWRVLERPFLRLKDRFR